MAKRVICECPLCHTDTIVSTALLTPDRLFDCPACGAVMEVDIGVPSQPSQAPPPETVRSGRPPALPPSEAPAAEPPHEDAAPAPPPKQIAKTMPMHVSVPAPPTTSAPPRSHGAGSRRAAAGGISPAVLIAVAVASAAAGWIAGSQSSDGLENLRAHCEREPGTVTVEQLCAELTEAP